MSTTLLTTPAASLILGAPAKRRMAPRWALPALVAVCCLLAAAYSAIVPAFEAPDEPGHYAYVEWLLEGKGIPLQGQEPPPLQPEFSQPPLYYLVEAPFALLAGDQPANLPEWEAQHNPFQDQTDAGNVNLYFHLPREDFPWTGTVLGLHLMRLANLVFVALMVLAVYGCAVELGWSRALALASAALVGLVPQVLFMGGVLNADNAIGSLSALALYLVLRWFNRGPSARLAALLGLALGGAALAKLSGLAAAAVALAFMVVDTAWVWKGSHRPPVKALRDIVLAAVFAAVVAGWWYARNWLSLGDPLGWSAMLPATGSMQRTVPWDFGTAAARLFVRCYTGLAAFGWANLLLNAYFYRLALLLGILCIVAAGIGAFRVAQKGRLRLAHLLLAAWFLVFFISLTRWVEVNSAADQWRLLFPVYPVLGLVVAFGFYKLALQRWQPLLALSCALTALNVGAIALTIAPAYAAARPYAGSIEHPLNVHFGDALQLAGYSTPHPSSVAAGSVVEFDLYWRALKPIDTNYATDLATIDAAGHIVWKQQSMPDEGRSPMAQWRPGDLMLDRHHVRVTPAMHGSQTLLLSVIDPAPPGDHLAATEDGQRLPNDTVTLDRFLAEPLKSPAPAVNDGVSFQDHLELVGHTVEKTGGTLRLTLDWKATGHASKDYTVFVHLLSNDGKQLAQNDSQPDGGAFPTSLLPSGLDAPDTHMLNVAGLPPGDYRLEVGLYELASGARLPTASGAGSIFLPLHLA